MVVVVVGLGFMFRYYKCEIKVLNHIYNRSRFLFYCDEIVETHSNFWF